MTVTPGEDCTDFDGYRHTARVHMNHGSQAHKNFCMEANNGWTSESGMDHIAIHPITSHRAPPTQQVLGHRLINGALVPENRLYQPLTRSKPLPTCSAAFLLLDQNLEISQSPVWTITSSESAEPVTVLSVPLGFLRRIPINEGLRFHRVKPPL